MRPDEGAADLDKRGQAEIEGRDAADERGTVAPRTGAGAASPAGPHGAPGLTDPAATPGAGALPGTSPDDEADPATC